MRRLLFALGFLAVVTACSNEGEPGSCYRNPDNACVEYGKAMGGAGKRLCSAFTWRAGEKSCPAENRLGTCIKEKGTVTEIVYGGAPNNYTTSTAKNACEFKGGVFTPPSSAASASPSASSATASAAAASTAAGTHSQPVVEKAREAALNGNPGEVRKLLEKKVRSGQGTLVEAKLVRAACRQQDDLKCADEVKAKYPGVIGGD